MQNGTRRQAGGILVFILVGIALAALLGGGIYLSKQQGRVASQTDIVATDTAKTDDTTSDAAPNGANKDDEVKVTPQPQTANPTPTTPAPTPDRNVAGVPATGPSNIAATGPSDVIVPMLAVSLLAGGAISYHRSTLAVRTQALKRGL